MMTAAIYWGLAVSALASLLFLVDAVGGGTAVAVAVLLWSAGIIAFLLARTVVRAGTTFVRWVVPRLRTLSDDALVAIALVAISGAFLPDLLRWALTPEPFSAPPTPLSSALFSALTGLRQSAAWPYLSWASTAMGVVGLACAGFWVAVFLREFLREGRRVGLRTAARDAMPIVVFILYATAGSAVFAALLLLASWWLLGGDLDFYRVVGSLVIGTVCGVGGWLIVGQLGKEQMREASAKWSSLIAGTEGMKYPKYGRREE